MNSDNIIFLGFADNKIPTYKEVTSKDWILFGEDNLFPSHLLYLYNKSSNHNAIVNGKVTYIFGKGLPDGNFAVNTNGETMNKVLRKFTHDIELFGGGRIEVLWKMGGGVELRHLPFQMLRRAKERNGYWYSKDWTNVRKNIPVFIPDFDPNNKTGAQVFAYNEYRPGIDAYPLPGYFGALNDIETDVEISKYNLSIIKNGMFSSKMIVFNNGVPPDDIKRKIERDFKNKFTGSENGGNFMLVFNQDPAKAPVVQDLSTTDLDKLFDQLNKTTQAEIFSGHLVTSPMLFGIKTEGQLGGRNEILEAYEIFKNTYISDKQQALNACLQTLLPLVGKQPAEVVPVEPISKQLDPVQFKDMLPKAWVMEQLGIDPAQYPEAANMPGPGQPAAQLSVNENLKNLTGKQNQQLERILRRYKQGKLSRVEAAYLLKSSYGICDDDIAMLLGADQFSAEEWDEEEVAAMFSAVGEAKKNYTIVRSMSFSDVDAVPMAFADLSQVDSNILGMIKKDPNVQETIDYRPRPEAVDVFVKYSYELRPGVKGDEVIETTRPFCRRLLELDRVYTRAEIETISQRLGYSVFDRAGGWWGSKPKCRHEWRRLLVIKKKAQ